MTVHQTGRYAWHGRYAAAVDLDDYERVQASLAGLALLAENLNQVKVLGFGVWGLARA